MITFRLRAREAADDAEVWKAWVDVDSVTVGLLEDDRDSELDF